MVWDLFTFKGDLILGKARSWRVPNLGCRGGRVTWVIWCLDKNLCMRYDSWAGALLWWSCQSPVAHGCILLNHLNSFHGGMLSLNTKFDACLLLYLLNHVECYRHREHTLTQWHLPPPLTSSVWSSHSSPLSLANTVQTVLVILTMAELFPDSLPPPTHTHTHTHTQ